MADDPVEQSDSVVPVLPKLPVRRPSAGSILSSKKERTQVGKTNRSDVKEKEEQEAKDAENSAPAAEIKTRRSAVSSKISSKSKPSAKSTPTTRKEAAVLRDAARKEQVRTSSFLFSPIPSSNTTRKVVLPAA